MHYRIVVERFPRCQRERRQIAWCALLLVACLAPTFKAHARDLKTHASVDTTHAADQLAIKVEDDRLTLSVTDVPQVYLYGVIDAGAPQRFAEQMQSGKIPHGADVYLNSSHGDLRAGLALGRLFRSGGMVTHLGTPRKRLPALNTSVCVDACAYAYLGGLYRWAPTGSDRIGLSSYPAKGSGIRDTGPAQSTTNGIASYLKDMGIQPDRLAPAPTQIAAHDAMAWWTAEQMIASGLANNGRLPISAKYQSLSGKLLLTLDQVSRHGEQRMTIECKPGSVMLAAYAPVGATRAKEILMRGARSYFEINRKETLTQQQDIASVAGDSLVITRPFPPARLEYIIFAPSVGAWIGDRNSAFRYGFTFDLVPVRSTLKDFYNACWQAAPWPIQHNS